MIGEAEVVETPLGPPLHAILSTVWSTIARFGLSEGESKLLLGRNPLSPDCSFLEPPKVNAAVRELMDLKLRERDDRIVQKQQLLAAALAGIGVTVSPYLGELDESESTLLQPLFDAARLLETVFHGESVMRRTMLIRLVNPNFQETVEEAEIGEFLFGTDLLERIRQAKALKQSAADLQKPKPSNLQAPRARRDQTRARLRGVAPSSRHERAVSSDASVE